MRDKSISLVILLALGALAVSCDKGTPVAPAGATLTVSANPAEIGVFGTSMITVVAQRGNGVPVNPGTEIRLTTTLGELPEVVTTDSRGIARAELRAGDRAGTARITAASGTAESAVVEVSVGFRAAHLVLQAEPQSVGEGGGAVTVTAQVRDEHGGALSGATVLFAAPVGSFTASTVQTDSSGRAATTLNLSAADLRNHSGGEIEITAEATAAGASANASVRVQVRRAPQAGFSSSTSGLQVIFTDTSTGNPTSWHWTFGDGHSRNVQNPTHTYGAAGTYTVTLVVSNADGSDSQSQFVTVTQP